MLTKPQAINAYRRTRDLEQRMIAQLNAEILIPEFGQNYCRLHNCLVNWEYGHIEAGERINGQWVPNPAEHRRQAELAKLYNSRQRKIWDTCRRLADHFARFF